MTQREQRKPAAGLRTMEDGGLGFAEGAQFAGAALRGGGRNVIWESGCARAGAHRVGKHVKVSERARLDEMHCGGVIVFGFARESGDDVSADGGVRKLLANEFDAPRVVFGTIPAMHRGENVVGAGLKRHVKVLGEAVAGRKECDEIAGDVEGFDGAEAEAFDGSLIKNLAQQIEKITAWRKIPPPCAEIDATENDFFVAGFRESADFADDSFRTEAAALSTNERDDAEGAAVVAAVLNF